MRNCVPRDPLQELVFHPAGLHPLAHGPTEHEDLGPRSYGFIDSFNLDYEWYSANALAITLGAAYLSLANLQEDTSIWSVFMRDLAIQRGLERVRALPKKTIASQ